MQWLIDIIKKWIVAEGYLLHSFVNRGAAAVPDKVVGDFTKDGIPHVMDLSGVVPPEAIAIAVRVKSLCAVTNAYLKFWRPADGLQENRAEIISQFTGVPITKDVIIGVSPIGGISYVIENLPWSIIDFTVKGWWL